MCVAYYGEYASSHSEIIRSGEEYLERTGCRVGRKGWHSSKRWQGAEEGFGGEE